jgi:hypothetical protein
MVLPTKLFDTITWFEQRLPQWTSNGAVLKLSNSDLTALSQKVSQARTAWEQAEAARIQSRDMTLAYHNAVESLRQLGSAYIAGIKAEAEKTKNPNIYVLASIPPPSQPTPAGTPNPPTTVDGQLDNLGYVRLKWNGSKRHNTFFSVWRSLQGEDAYTQIAVTGTKDFLDTAIPGGTVSASYIVRAHRGALVSDGSEPVIILLSAVNKAAA